MTPALFALADNPHDMAKLSVEQIKECVATCGLANSKAKNIKALSEMLVSNYDGEVPRTFEELEQLPGVGHKTASVVMIHAFKIPAFRSTPTSIDSPSVGDSPTAKALYRPKPTVKNYGRQKSGKNCICKSSPMVANTAPPAAATAPSAKSAAPRTQTAKKPFIAKKA